MHVGLIAPFPHLGQFAVGPFHLILAQCLNNPTYLAHYQKQAGEGAFLLLDCDTHELGEGERPKELLEWAKLVGASEVVAPDVLFEAERTVNRTHNFLQYALDHLGPRTPLTYCLVPQGQSPHEWAMCLTRMVSAHTAYFPYKRFTVGISKDYEVWPGGTLGLIQKYVVPLRKGVREVNVHLLGWGRELHRLTELQWRFPWIRSTDSAKPFVYARAGIELNLSQVNPAYPKRPDDYFTREMTFEQQVLAQVNVDVFRARAGNIVGSLQSTLPVVHEF